MKRAVVIGGNGQLGQCLKNADPFSLEMVFLGSGEANILESSSLTAVFDTYQPDIIINCAAYTAVDLAEDEPLKAAAINAQGPELLAQLCLERDVSLIHISTDFVFGGSMAVPLTETDITEPVNMYGKTKLQGEEGILKWGGKVVIIRTSWLYSEYGNNFVKTMLRLGKERGRLQVVADQFGTPTYAMDLAEAIVGIADGAEMTYGVFHYSNEGAASWYDFACEIFRKSGLHVQVEPVSSSQFPTKAVRPKFSVMDKSKIKNTYGCTIHHWVDSLEKCMKKI